MSDGGEGLLQALGGTRRTTVVTGPLGARVAAEWRSSRSAGATPHRRRSRCPVPLAAPCCRAPRGDDPVRAATTGVGELLLAARDAGARRIVVGCGGSATTDGGVGVYEAVGTAAALDGIELVVACDVTDRASSMRQPSSGPRRARRRRRSTTSAGVLSRRPSATANETGVDVTGHARAGAAGGLAGGLLALGARIEPGFNLVAT